MKKKIISILVALALLLPGISSCENIATPSEIPTPPPVVEVEQELHIQVNVEWIDEREIFVGDEVTFKVIVSGVPEGMSYYVTWQYRIDGGEWIDTPGDEYCTITLETCKSYEVKAAAHINI